MTAPYLTEKGWKDQLAKPKNLGLRAQGTGISALLRKYEAANRAFGSQDPKTVAGAAKVLTALAELRTEADKHSKSHKNFSEASKYLAEVVKAVDTRSAAVTTARQNIAKAEKDRQDLLAKLKTTTDEAIKRVATIKAAADWLKKGPKTLNQDVKDLMQAGTFKGISGDTMAKLNNRLLAEPQKTTAANLGARKTELTGFLNDLKKQLAAVKDLTPAKH